jgi:hypothetical protein
VLINPFGTVYLDGTEVRGEERGWFETQLQEGRYLLRATHPGWGDWEKEIELTQEVQEVRINFLQTRRVNITTRGIHGATIYVDGQPQDVQTPSSIDVRIGRRRIAVEREGYTAAPPYVDVLIEGDEPEPLRIVFDLNQ